MKVECRGQEREDLCNQLTTLDRREIDQKFPDLDEDARWYKYRTAHQINRLLTILLMTNRNGIIQPENTRIGYERGLVGGETSLQGEKRKAANATLNAIANARIKEDNRVAMVEFFRTKFPDQIDALVTPEQAEVYGQRILDTKYPNLGDLSIRDFLRTYPMLDCMLV